MNNEKGLSLIEVLAAIVIFSLVMGVGIMLFASVQSLWSNTQEKQSSQHNINLTLHTIKEELAGAVEVYYHNGSAYKELRIKPFGLNSEYSSIYFDTTERTISLYRLQNTTNFTGSFTPVTNPGEYAKVIDLADDLNNFEVLIQTQLITLDLTFEKITKTAQGGSINSSDTFTITQKLIKD